MEIQQAYNIWADQYDGNENKTRDLEASALRSCLADLQFENCLELGCGTGKNTPFLMLKANKITAVDFAEAMLEKARSKINSKRVQFMHADLTKEWGFAGSGYDLVTFSLVLEHIEDLQAVLKKSSAVMRANGLLYIGELHPFKQYTGSKAKFTTSTGTNVLNCFNHHVSDFTNAAQNNGFRLLELAEYFDDDDRNAVPRIISLMFRKGEGS